MATRTSKTAKKAPAKKAAPKKAAPKKPAARKVAPKKVAPKSRKKVTPVPEDFPAMSAHLTVADMKKAIAFYQKVFGFTLLGEPMKMGKEIIHAVMAHGKSGFMLGGHSPDGTHLSPNALGLTHQAFGLFVYVPDVDAHWKRVKRQKGLTFTTPETMFWGDRSYDVTDRDGHRWTFASRVAILTPEEMNANLQALMAKMQQAHAGT